MDQPAAGGASPVEAKAPRIPRAYTPRRLTPADSVLIPVSRLELTQSRTSQNPLRTRPPVVDFDYPVASTSQIPLTPQTRPSSLPRRPEAFDQLVGRKRPNAGDPVALQKRPKSDGDVRAVADHCESWATRWGRRQCADQLGSTQTMQDPTLTVRHGVNRPSSRSRASTIGSSQFSSPSTGGVRERRPRGSRCLSSDAGRVGTCRSGPRRGRTSTSE